MGKSFLDHSIGTMKGNNKLETGLVHDMIGAGKQCRLKGESQCQDGSWARIRKSLCSKQLKMQLRVEGQSLTGAMVFRSKYSCRVAKFSILSY